MGLKNHFFASLDDVIQKICEVINLLLPETISHITLRNCILSATINEHFNNEFDKMHKNDLAG